MSIETELKTFNEHFGRFIKTEEEKTAAISKLADAISQAVISPAEMRMQPSPAPVLNEAKSAKVQHSILVRLMDKMERIKTLLTNGENNRVTDEKVEDTLLDMANYCLMEVVERYSEKENEQANSRQE